MTTKTTTYLCFAALFTSACLSNPIEVASDESSSSGDGDDNTTFSSQSATVGTSVSVSSTTSADDGSSGESDGSDSGTDGTSDSGTTGETTDWALAFDGDSHARSFADYGWGLDEITVEAWVQITDIAATGIIVDAQAPTLDGGWAFYIHPESGRLIFSFFDDQGATHFLEGPATTEIGLGWHHLAAVKAHDVGISLFVDGVLEIQQGPVTQAISDVYTQITIGGHVNDSDDFALRGASIDDVVISRAALYGDDFIPSSEPTSNPDTMLLMRFDEGEGTSTSAEDLEVFTIVWPTWVPGHS